MRFAPAIFLSALLLFLLQSLVGKQLLPWFGGAPGTWAACMMFFQGMLLAGYAYAWALDRWCPPVWQRRVHGGLMVLAGVGTLLWGNSYGAPLLAPAAWQPQGSEAPVWLILKVLFAGTGLPFLALAANGPLLQRWSVETGMAPARIFRLYALSNAGSLIGLLGFPFLLEPLAPLPSLAWLWSGGFALLVLLLLLAGWRAPIMAGQAEVARQPVSHGRRFLQVALSAVACAGVLSTTNQLCQEIAMVPFLWVLPLTLYLVAFMLAFHDERWYRRERMAAPLALLTLVALGFAIPGAGIPAPWVILVLGVFLFVFCHVCLGELFRLRPAAQELTGFYLAVAFGGALGGMAVGLGAPLLLVSVTEFPWSVLVGWLVLLVVWWSDRTSCLHRGDVKFYHAMLFFVSAGLFRLINLAMQQTIPAWLQGWPPALLGGLIFTMAGYAATKRFSGWVLWRFWPQAMVGTVLLVAFAFTMEATRGAGFGVLASGRNLFGAVRVQKADRKGVHYTRLVHGQVNHGIQYRDAPRRHEPSGYCDRNTGVGRAIAGHARRLAGQPIRIGVAGLGVGAMAAYLQPGDGMRFYEINPLVTSWASGPDAFFSYTRDSAGKTETVTADARLALAREYLQNGSQNYDLLVLDAFSSDSVPVHLLTVEAFTLYLKHLHDSDSMIAVNISNRFLDFRPLLRGVAAHFNLESQLFYDPGKEPVPTPNLWMILGKKRASFFDEAKGPTLQLEPAPPILWTDTRSDILGLLRWTTAPLAGIGADVPPGQNSR